MPIWVLMVITNVSVAENSILLGQNKDRSSVILNNQKVNEIQNENKKRNQDTVYPRNSDDSWIRLSSFINTFSTAILAFLTFIYVLLTYRILREMKETKQPAIEIDFDVKTSTLHEVFVWVKNAGLSPAKNIRIDVEDTLPLMHLYELKDTTLSDANFIKSSIPYLAPGRSKKYVVGNLKLNREIWKANDYIVKFTVHYENMKSRKHNVNLSVDVLQCIDPVVFRGQESLGPGYEVRLDKQP